MLIGSRDVGCWWWTRRRRDPMKTGGIVSEGIREFLAYSARKGCSWQWSLEIENQGRMANPGLLGKWLLKQCVCIYALWIINTRHQTLVNVFTKYWPILKFLSLLHSAGNLKYKDHERFHHALNASLHYLQWSSVYCKFLADWASERILKNGQYLMKIWTSVWCLVFLLTACMFTVHISNSCIVKTAEYCETKTVIQVSLIYNTVTWQTCMKLLSGSPGC